ncbi:MAG: DUF2191 domain-containing protein [Bryobacteraceae bacterium]
MKTTLEIPDSLFAEAKACAQSRGVPFRQIVEDGLRVVIQRDRKTRAKFKLRDGSFGGEGLRETGGWPAVREAIYRGRGE